MKKKMDVSIKKKNQGSFTEYCKRNGYAGVTGGCIEEGLASKSAKINKRAMFAKNAIGWNHSKKK